MDGIHVYEAGYLGLDLRCLIYETMMLGVDLCSGDVGWCSDMPKIAKNGGHFYGMELPRVGAFTEKWGSGYRNPVQILRVFCIFTPNSGNLGLV